MAGYAEFVVEIAKNPDTYTELMEVLPFKGIEELKKWFSGKNYSLSDEDANSIFENQDSMLNGGEQINY